MLWHFQISPLLKSHKLFKYVDGTIKAPPATLRVAGQSPDEPAPVNPEYEQWYERDQALITLINATLSQTALSHVIGCKTSKEVWDRLAKHFSSSTRTNIVGLKSELQSITKKPNESIDLYVQRINDVVNRWLLSLLLLIQKIWSLRHQWLTFYLQCLQDFSLYTFPDLDV